MRSLRAAFPILAPIKFVRAIIPDGKAQAWLRADHSKSATVSARHHRPAYRRSFRPWLATRHPRAEFGACDIAHGRFGLSGLPLSVCLSRRLLPRHLRHDAL